MIRFYQKQHPFYCGIDLNAKTIHVCIVNHAREMLAPVRRLRRSARLATSPRADLLLKTAALSTHEGP